MPPPVGLAATPDNSGLVWTTQPYYPPDYSGTSFSHPFRMTPSSGSFPSSSSAPSVTVTASDDNGVNDDNGQGNVTSYATSQVLLTASASNSNGLGTGLNLTIVLTYSTGMPK
jgi:hypothetical protein